jgi:hypothetical protein
MCVCRVAWRRRAWTLVSAGQDTTRRKLQQACSQHHMDGRARTCKRKASYEFEKHACMKWNANGGRKRRRWDRRKHHIIYTTHMSHERDRKSQPKRLALNFLSILHWSLIWTPRFDTNLMPHAVYFSLRSKSEVILGFLDSYYFAKK